MHKCTDVQKSGGGDFEDSLSKLSLVIFLFLLQLIKRVFLKLFQFNTEQYLILVYTEKSCN